ncbi:ATP-binding cassette domain-containing protein [Lentilactobacillus sunkii]|nr:ABC transporter ATP-binding protein [Lentilactobacillus sunkii]
MFFQRQNVHSLGFVTYEPYKGSSGVLNIRSKKSGVKMKSTKLFSYIALKDYPFLIIAKVYINGFNVFVSVMLQYGVAAALAQKLTILYQILGVLTIASLIYAGVYYTYSMYSERLRKRVIESVSQELLASSLREIDLNQDNGTMVNLVNQDADNIANYFMMGVMPAIDFVMIIGGGLIYTFYNSWIYGLVYLFIGGGLYAIAHHFYVQDVRYRRAYQLSDDQQKNFLPDVYHNLSIIRIFNASKWLTSVNNRLFDSKRTLLRQDVGATASSNGVVRGGIYVMEVVSLFVGLLLVNAHQIHFDVMLGIWNAGIGSIFDPFLTLPIVLAFMARQKVSLGRVANHLSAHPNPGQPLPSAEEPVKSIEGQEITYQYPKNNHPTLMNLSFTIKPGKITFLIGRNGAGKTTLLHILLGVLTVNSGSLMVRTNAGHNLSSLADHAAFVPQAGQMFNTTIADNLKLGKSVTNQELTQALIQVQMFDAVNSLPKKLESVVGEDTNFSKGQIRRLAIARALLTHRQYLILDEPFSDIDESNQKSLIQLFRKIAHNHGIIIVSHTFDLIEPNDHVIKVGD